MNDYEQRLKEIFATYKQTETLTKIFWQSNISFSPLVGIYINPEQPIEERIPHSYKMWYVTNTELEHIKKNKVKYDFDEERDIITRLSYNRVHKTRHGFAVVYAGVPMKIGSVVKIIDSDGQEHWSYIGVISPKGEIEYIISYNELVKMQEPTQFIDELQKYINTIFILKGSDPL